MGVSLKDAFAGIREAQTEPKPAPRKVVTSNVTKGGLRKTPEHGGRVAPARAALPLQNTANHPTARGTAGSPAKSKHPEFEPVKVYLRKQTRKHAQRKWEDAQGGDFSDLVEMLLQRYSGA